MSKSTIDISHKDGHYFIKNSDLQTGELMALFFFTVDALYMMRRSIKDEEFKIVIERLKSQYSSKFKTDRFMETVHGEPKEII